jgi:hypothetical protein
MKRAKTPTFLIELPLRVDWSQQSRLRAHLETARCLYNALLGEADKGLHQMCHDPAWASAGAIPATRKQERAQAYSHLRKKHHFSEYELHEYAKGARRSWIADHIDSTMAQTLASRAYQAVNRVCVGKANLVTFCEELAPNTRKKRPLQRKMERQRRANNPENYDEKGRVKKHGKTCLRWKESKRYTATRRQHANTERRLAAHRKSLHGKLAHDIVQVGNTINIEKTSFKGWQKQYGKSIGLRAPGMFVAHLTRIVAKTGGTLREVSAYQTKLSQYCHQCQQYVKKPGSQRWHTCPCGCGPVQRDLYSAFLLAHLGPQQTIPSVTQHVWEGAEPRLRAVIEGLQQRANEGHALPRSMGLLASRKAVRAGARRLKSPAYPQQELALFTEKQEALGEQQEPPLL